MGIMKQPPIKSAVFQIRLTAGERETLRRLCEQRGQTAADFLRAAIKAADSIPIEQSPRALGGWALRNHEERLKREKRAARRKSTKGE